MVDASDNQATNAKAMNPAKFSWNSVLLWVAGTAAGWGIGMLPAIFLITDAFWNGGDYAPPGFIQSVICIDVGIGALSVAAVGAVQWWVLNHYIADNDKRWLLVTMIGGVISWVLGWVFSLIFVNSLWSSKPVFWTTSGAAVGLIQGITIGISQWRLLNSWGHKAIAWIPTSVVAWAAGGLVYWLAYGATGAAFDNITTSYYEPGHWPKTIETPGAGLGLLAGWIAGGLVVGVLTGLGVIFLVSRSSSKQLSPA